jgi:deoxyribose-phosphate aldolase
VRDLEGLRAMVAAGASRVGASAGVKIVREARGESASQGGAKPGAY